MNKTYQGYTSINRGFAKGFRIHLDSNNITRPTKNIVKKSLFDTINIYLQDISFVECFCGSGQVGLNALSMGAREAIFFKKNIDSFKNLHANISNFKNRFSNTSIKSYNIDFFNSKAILENIENNMMLYIDPPFSSRQGYGNIYKDINEFVHSFDKKIIRKIDIIVSEMQSLVNIKSIGSFQLEKMKKFGNTALAYFKIP